MELVVHARPRQLDLYRTHDATEVIKAIAEAQPHEQEDDADAELNARDEEHEALCVSHVITTFCV